MKFKFLFLLFFAPMLAFATGQMSDKLIYKGKTYSLLCNPLETFFAQNPKLRPSANISSTALWKGYVAQFKIQDNELLVDQVLVHNRMRENGDTLTKEWDNVLDSVFPGKSKVKVDWYTGLLILPTGEMDSYVHMGYGSTYTSYLIFEIREGNLVSERPVTELEFKHFRDNQFDQYKKTEAYQKQLKQLMKKGDTEEFLENFIKVYENDYLTVIPNYENPWAAKQNPTIEPAEDIELSDSSQVLVLVNGKKVRKETLDKMDPMKIESITIVKNKDKVRQYTKDACDAVMLITMKKKGKPNVR